jgi:hypothetical protein
MRPFFPWKFSFPELPGAVETAWQVPFRALDKAKFAPGAWQDNEPEMV